MINLLEQAINCGDGDRAAKLIQDVLGIESDEVDLAILHCCKLTAQQTWRDAILGRRPEGVDNADPRTRLKRWDEIVEQGVGSCDLVIRVHQDRNVERISCQSRIVGLTEAY
jgi:hypothetical protein